MYLAETSNEEPPIHLFEVLIVPRCDVRSLLLHAQNILWNKLDKQSLRNDKHEKPQSHFILFLLAVFFPPPVVEALGDRTSLAVMSRVMLLCHSYLHLNSSSGLAPRRVPIAVIEESTDK
jgi:hypothetical protein